MKRTIILTAMCMAAFALPTQAVEYPEREFRTTSSYIEQTQQVNPNMQYGTFTPADALLLNGETATKTNNGPKRIGGGESADEQPGTPQPIGDAALPLSLMALAFCGVVTLRRRKA